jgi:hypothetical protein
MPSTLIVGWGSEPAEGLTLQIQALQETVKRQVEIQAGLLAIRDHIQPRVNLIPNRYRHRIVYQLRPISFTKPVEMSTGKLQPSRERIAADHGRA